MIAIYIIATSMMTLRIRTRPLQITRKNINKLLKDGGIDFNKLTIIIKSFYKYLSFNAHKKYYIQ